MKKKKEKIVRADTEDGQILGETIIQIIENQIAQNDPPETKQTLDRLISLGESRANAFRYIGCVLSLELFKTLKHQEPYNNERYINNLNALPKLPDDYDDSEI